MSTSDLAILDNNERVPAFWSDNKALQEIKSLYAPKSTDLEFKAFVEMGKATGLNPFLREIWLVKYSQTDPAQIFIGRDGYRKLLSKTNGYEGHIVDAVYSNDEFHVDLLNGKVKHIPNLKDRGRLLGAYCIVYMKGVRIPAYTFVELSEYDLGRSLWKTHKATMIKKVAEAQTARMAVQACSGTYSPEEMPEHLVSDQKSKSEELNKKLNLSVDKETGEIKDKTEEVDIEERQEQKNEINTEFSEVNSPFTYEELIENMSSSNNQQDLNDLAATIAHLNLSKDQRDVLAKIYREKMKELKN